MLKNFFTSFLLVGIVSVTAHSAEWTGDYATALTQSREAHKPLLIVIDQPANPEFRLEQVRFVKDATQQALLGGYQLCHIDVTTEKGKAVARAFGATEFPYLAITDRTCKVIVFEKSGSFSTDQWVSTLVNYKNRTRPSSSDAICFT